MQELFQRYERLAWEGDAPQDESDKFYKSREKGHSPADWCDALQTSADGLYWSDIVYTDGERTKWLTLEHLTRIRSILIFFGKERLENDAGYRAKILSAVDFWLHKDFINPNWWYNQIGLQKTFNYTALMLKPYFSPWQREKVNEIIGRGTLTRTPGVTEWTGANLIWAVTDTITHALFLDDEALLKLAISYAANEIFIAKGDTEGIKEDGSFYQHGTQLYSGGYGVAYIHDLSLLMLQLTGTAYQLPQEKIDLLVDYILDGLTWFLRRNSINYLCKGREFSRPGAMLADGIQITLRTLLQVHEAGRKQELQAMLESISTDCADSFVKKDTRYFYKSYTLVQKSPDYNLSVKGAFRGFHSSECMNSENFLSRNFTYGGMTGFLYTGREYTDISAVWDFSMVPGTTAFAQNDDELYKWWDDRHSPYMVGSTTHCGGVGSGDCGALYVELLNEEGLHGLLSYFVKDGLLIALGTDLTCFQVDNERPIRTTLDQCYLCDNASYAGAPLQSGKITGGGAVCNGAFAYYNLGQGDMDVFAGSVTGSFHRNSTPQSEQPVTRDVFKLSLSHDKNVHGGSYGYAVLANAGGDAPENAAQLPVRHIINNRYVQAVEFADGKLLAVFHKDASFTGSNGKEYTADKPGAYIFD